MKFLRVLQDFPGFRKGSNGFLSFLSSFSGLSPGSSRAFECFLVGLPFLKVSSRSFYWAFEDFLCS